MEVGRNSYVTLEEANSYTTTFYDGATAERWNGKTDAQKEGLLMAACIDLDGLPFAGQKAVAGQSLMFPRGTSEVPQAIKYAQIEIALLPLRSDSAEAEQRLYLQRQGVTSFSLGDLSESYGTISGIVTKFPFLADAKISKLLSPYLRGGHVTC